ncbi:MAG: sodium:alanine symporter family protein [Marinilabiliaceae bacterium]|nr:sodium:alanine symporter family protein [Marinilabiliaceae bacterium]
MHLFRDILLSIDQFLGSSSWFVYVLLGTGLFFSIYLVFPQIRFFKYSILILRGKFDRKEDKGDTSHFQALATALSGTVGTGNIAGVALALHLGGPAALLWMLVTAFIGMTTKMVEVTLSHKYREFGPDGTVSGGPMYYMTKRLNLTLPSGKMVKTGAWLAVVFAIATVFTSFGTGSLPQMNSISNALLDTWGIPSVVTGVVLSLLLGVIIVGGIKRIAVVASALVPVMAVIYFIGAILVIAYNYQNIIPSLIQVGAGFFSGSSAMGGFLGASMAFAINRGVNRGLFSNEAGQGSAPIAHAAAKAHEPVSEGLVALLEPFIDTIIICSLTGLAILSSGAWNDKFDNRFQQSDIRVLAGHFSDKESDDVAMLNAYLFGQSPHLNYSGSLQIIDGKLTDDVTLLHNRSVAELVIFNKDRQPYSGQLAVDQGHVSLPVGVTVSGRSLLQSAPLTNAAFSRSWLGDWGKYIVSIGLLLFAFSTAISWSYYGSRAITFLFGSKAVKWYSVIYVIGFFLASMVDTTLVWIFSGVTVALMTLPNLLGMLMLHREVKDEIRHFWEEYRERFPNEKSPRF